MTDKPRKRRKRRAKEIYNPTTHDYTIVKPEHRPTSHNVRVRIRKKSSRNTRARAGIEMLKGIDSHKRVQGGQPCARAIRKRNEQRELITLIRELSILLEGRTK